LLRARGARKTKAAPNIVARRFNTTQPDARRVLDVRYIPTAQNWLYLAAIVDLYSHASVGWAIDHRLTRQINYIEGYYNGKQRHLF